MLACKFDQYGKITLLSHYLANNYTTTSKKNSGCPLLFNLYGQALQILLPNGSKTAAENWVQNVKICGQN